MEKFGSARDNFGRFLANLLITLGSLAIALAPIWFWLICSIFFDPQGFWQKFIAFGLGVYFLGGLQIFLLIAWVALTLVVWTKD